MVGVGPGLPAYHATWLGPQAASRPCCESMIGFDDFDSGVFGSEFSIRLKLFDSLIFRPLHLSVQLPLQTILYSSLVFFGSRCPSRCCFSRTVLGHCLAQVYLATSSVIQPNPCPVCTTMNMKWFPLRRRTISGLKRCILNLRRRILEH